MRCKPLCARQPYFCVFLNGGGFFTAEGKYIGHAPEEIHNVSASVLRYLNGEAPQTISIEEEGVSEWIFPPEGKLKPGMTFYSITNVEFSAKGRYSKKEDLVSFMGGLGLIIDVNPVFGDAG